MDRLQQISLSNPSWYLEIESFLLSHPEFGPYAYLIPLQRPSFKDRNVPKVFIEHLLRYMAEAGVNRNYSYKQWQLMLPVLKENGYNIFNMVEVLKDKLQPKKIEAYLDLWDKVKDVGPLQFTLSDLIQVKVKGVGPGCINHLKMYWSSETQIVEITDRAFIQGFQVIYPSVSKKDIQAKVNQWGPYALIGNLICTQIYHYLL